MVDTARLRAAYDYLVSQGAPPRLAIGMLGQAVNEGGWDLNTGAVGDKNAPGGSSLGVFQHRLDRRTNLENYKDPNAQDPLQNNLSFAWNELKTRYPKVYERMLAAKTAEEMTEAATGFESPLGYTAANPRGADNFSGRLAATRDIPGMIFSEGTAPSPSGGGSAVAAPARNIEELKERILAAYPQARFTSEYRSPAQNQAAGGVGGSQHLKNLAIDVAGKGLDDATKQAIVDAALGGGARGIGYYPKSDSFHFDLRTGAPAAWGQNKSHTSLGGTPTWFQDRAQALRSGKAFTSDTSGKGGFWETGEAPGGTGGGSTADPSGPGAGPAPEEPGFSAGFDQALAETQAQQAAQAAQPLPPEPEPAKPLVADAVPGLDPGDQVQAADLMTNLLQRKRAQRPGMPQGVLSAWG